MPKHFLLELLQPLKLVYCLFLFYGYLQLGDPGAKGASYANFHLSNLLTDHPNMKVLSSLGAICFLFYMYVFGVSLVKGD